MQIKDTLFVITARGGSKGLPRKNILPLNGKPMIYYSIDAARILTSDENICVSTEDLEIKNVVENYGLKVPFIRPKELASDTASSREVLLHAISFYENQLNLNFKKVCLLQPTSPLRKFHHILEAYKIWEDNLDMIVSVKKTKISPILLNYENENGFLQKIEKKDIYRRQDLPEYYLYNGAIYIINIKSLKEKQFFEFQKVKKYLMSEEDSIDIDSSYDFKIAEFLLKIK